MVYPFAPALARGLGVSEFAIYRLVTIRSAAGFLGPVFAPLSERYGRKPIIILGILLFSLGCLLVVVWPNYWLLGVSLTVVGIAKVIFDPAMQSYLGETVPYRQRGRALSVTEFAWGGAWLVGAPMVGVVIARQGWQAVFAWFTGLSLIAVGLLWWVLPPSQTRPGHSLAIRQVWLVMKEKPVVWAVALFTLLVMVANEILFIVYGSWMETSFKLNLTTLGLASGVIGGAEIIGELLGGWSVDRFGKRPVVITMGLLNAVAYLLIPFVGQGLNTAMLVLFILVLFFEMAVVGGMPLLTEVLPSARSVVLSVSIAAGALGRTIGSLVGPALATRGGFALNSVVSAVVMVAAVLTLARWIKEES